MKKKLLQNFRKFVLITLGIFISTQIGLAQTATITGSVADSNGDVLPGAIVQIKGTNTGTTSDMKGFFELKGISVGEKTIQVSFIGYLTEFKTVTVEAGKTIELSFVLKESGITLSDVVVTASKRSERIQDVPMAISAISTKGIEELGVTEAVDYLTTISGVHINSVDPSTNVVSIRGVQPLGGWAQSVGYYIGETPVYWLPAVSSFDVERMEVLRGPQGTLYGEGSMGGTVKIIPNEPNSYKFEAMINPEVSSTTGGGLNYYVNGMINLPIIKDKLAVRTTGYYKNDDGFINNVGTSIDNANTFNDFGGRVSAKYFASNKFIISASVLFDKTKTGDLFVANEDYEQSTTIETNGDQNYSAYTLNADYDFSFASLIVAGTYYQLEKNGRQDLAALLPQINYVLGLGGIPPRTAAWTDRIDKTDISSLEARMASTGDGPLKWTTGLFYKDFHQNIDLLADTKDHLDAALIEALMEAGFGVPGVTELYDETNTWNVKQASVFGELSYDITPKLNVLGGIRLMNEKRNFSNLTDGMFPILISGLLPEERVVDKDETVINPKFVISYKATDDVLVYANASKGFRSGGQNLYSFLYPGTKDYYNSETLWNYELGLKSTLLKGKLIANAAFYYNNWTDMQIVTRSISDLNRIYRIYHFKHYHILYYSLNTVSYTVTAHATGIS